MISPMAAVNGYFFDQLDENSVERKMANVHIGFEYTKKDRTSRVIAMNERFVLCKRQLSHGQRSYEVDRHDNGKVNLANIDESRLFQMYHIKALEGRVRVSLETNGLNLTWET